jgi:glycosyltransferase involved in cell wall biosynthesis
MAASDLFVLPSLFEGLPIVLLEAMAVGVPIVGTRICGTREAITDGVTGRLVEAKVAPALAEAIRAALQQPQVTTGWRKAARLRFEREFSAARMAREVLAIYTALAPLPAAPPYGMLLKVEQHRS